MVSRRQFLAGAFIVSLPAAIDVTRTSSATANSANRAATLSPLDVRTLQVPSGTFTQLFDVPYAQLFELSTQSTGPLVVSVSYDDRMFSPSEVAVLASGSHLEAVPIDEMSTDPNRAAMIAYHVPAALNTDGSDATIVPIPLTPRSLYPNDSIDDPKMLGITVRQADGVVLATATQIPAQRGEPVSHWGAEVTARWSTVMVVDGSSSRSAKYRHPSSVLCKSVGPSGIPAGSTLTIDIDSGVISSCAVGAIGPTEWNGTVGTRSSDADGCLRTEITLNDEVPGGMTLSISLDATLEGKPGEISSFVAASATLSGPADGTWWPRDTRRYTTTDITASGTPLLEKSIRGTV